LALGFLGAAGTTAQADPIEVAGVDLAMTTPEIANQLEMRGFNCSYNESTGMCAYGDEIMIGIFQDLVRFRCGVFEACPYSAAEVAHFWIEDGIVATVEYVEHSSLGGMAYCGEGPDGDRLCVSEKDRRISLERGKLGAARPSFD
jgi:hypothetical protein